ncbi:MAG TPA: hypothetical protein VIF82_19090 [Burkholderiaceae bacterium]|jgi:hypothetical protein
MLAVVDYQRPQKLYRYSKYESLERSFTLGEFRPLPSLPDETMRQSPGSEQILPFKPSKPQSAAAPHYLTLSLANAWDEKLFDKTAGTDSCLIIHKPEEFGERIHRAVRKLLPNWAGIDAAISYGVPSPLGAAFSKSKHNANQKEWLFAWRPIQPTSSMQPVVIQIGSIESMAELHRETFKTN